MDPFSRAAKRFSVRSAVFWKVRKLAVLRAVVAADHRAELVDALRWEEAQPECRRPLVVVDEPFEEAGMYFGVVVRRILETYESLRAAAVAAGVSLADAKAPVSPEPILRAVSTANAAAAALPAALDGVAVLLCPARVSDVSEWAVQIRRLLKVATALPAAAAGARAQPVRWIVHDIPGGPHSAALGEGVDFQLDDGALFAWWKRAGERGRPKTAPPIADPAKPAGAALSPSGAAALRRHIAEGVEALRKNAPDQAAVSFHAARGMCAGEGQAMEQAALWIAIAGVQLAASAAEDAESSYRAAADLAIGQSAPSLACQAKLGEAGALLLQKRHGDAARVYVHAAELAEKAKVTVLRVEALRMAGLCAVLAGDRQQAG